MNSGFTVILPARLSSSRLPEKALADIAGKPMIVRTAEAAAHSRAQRVVVATDSPAIQAACRAHGVESLMTRADHASGTDRIAEAARLLMLPEDAAVVNVQGDEPLIDPQLIDALAAFFAAKNTDMATAAHPFASAEDFHNPNAVKVVTDKADNALYFSRAPIPYHRSAPQQNFAGALHHIGIYAYRCAFLQKYASLPAAPQESAESLEQLRVLWHGGKIAVLTTAIPPAAGVDTAADLARVRSIFAQTHNL